ncbi:hypothetical protein [Chelativorans xinjiangense]|uniref:hypothetical protein n=1 Tax=Chelativorans xinjiangense TaxID=2681485 RepID=UPI00135C5A3C|nr:hypothetical protein [Chelativorans xinjiangense]
MSRNPLEVDEAANIAVSKMLRQMYHIPTLRILELIDAGLSLEEAERACAPEPTPIPGAILTPEAERAGINLQRKRIREMLGEKS